MQVIYLTRGVRKGGRDHLGGRLLVDLLQAEHGDVVLGHVIFGPEIADDVIKHEAFLQFAPDAIILEGGPFEAGGMWRVPRVQDVGERSSMPERGVPVRGLFESHLTVSDLGRSVTFYRDVVGLAVALEMPERGAAFFWCGSPGKAMLGLWSLGSAPMGLNLHIAFDVELEHVLASTGRLKALGVSPLSFFGEETDEPTVIGWMPAAAVYFRDPDGHLLEYLAMLDEGPRADLGIIPWSEWTQKQ